MSVNRQLSATAITNWLNYPFPKRRLVIDSGSNGEKYISYRDVGFFARLAGWLGFGSANLSNVLQFIAAHNITAPQGLAQTFKDRINRYADEKCVFKETSDKIKTLCKRCIPIPPSQPSSSAVTQPIPPPAAILRVAPQMVAAPAVTPPVTASSSSVVAPATSTQSTNPFRSFGEALLTAHGLPKHLIQAGHVAIVDVPNGISIRLSTQPTALLTRLKQLCGEPEAINYKFFRHEFVLPLDAMHTIVQAYNLDANLIDQLVQASPIHSAFLGSVLLHGVFDKKFLRPAFTLSVHLAHWDPEQHAILSPFRRNPRANLTDPSLNLKLPLIIPTVHGLEVWFKEGCPDFAEKVSITLRRTLEEESRQEPFGTYDKVIKIPRDDIPEFLEQLGLNNFGNVLVNSPSNNVEIFVRELKALGKFYKYTPVLVEGQPLASLANSLKVLVPEGLNLGIKAPLVVFHPVRGLIVRMPKNNPEDFTKSLLKFLKVEAASVSCTVATIEYDKEIVIELDDLEAFLKKPMKLDSIASALVQQLTALKTTLGEIWGKQKFDLGVTEIRVLNTASRRLFALTGPDQAAQITGQSHQSRPELTFALPNLVASPNQLEILLRADQASTPVAGRASTDLNFAAYIGAILGITPVGTHQTAHGKAYTTSLTLQYAPSVENNRILGFFEKDLGLRNLPTEHHINARFERRTFWNEFLVDNNKHYGLKNEECGYGKVSKDGLKIRPRALVPPPTLPDYTDAQIIQTLTETLRGAGCDEDQIATYIDNYDGLLIRIPTTLPSGIPQLTRAALRHFIFELQKSPSMTTVEVKKMAIISVAEDCGHCLPGTYVRLTSETERVAGREQDAQELIRVNIDGHKSSLLTEILSIKRDGSEDFQSVHTFAAAQDEWGDEFGLDAEAGRRDPNRLNYGSGKIQPNPGEAEHPHKTKFRDNLRDDTLLVPAILERIQMIRDDDGAIMNVALYREGVRKILIRQGYNKNEIDNKLERYFPTGLAWLKQALTSTGCTPSRYEEILDQELFPLDEEKLTRMLRQNTTLSNIEELVAEHAYDVETDISLKAVELLMIEIGYLNP